MEQDRSIPLEKRLSLLVVASRHHRSPRLHQSATINPYHACTIPGDGRTSMIVEVNHTTAHQAGGLELANFQAWMIGDEINRTICMIMPSAPYVAGICLILGCGGLRRDS